MFFFYLDIAFYPLSISICDTNFAMAIYAFFACTICWKFIQIFAWDEQTNDACEKNSYLSPLTHLFT